MTAITEYELNQLKTLAEQRHITQSVAFQLAIAAPDLLEAIRAQRTALIAWQFQAAGAALENQRLRAVLKSVEEIVLEAPELNMSNFDEDQVSSLNEAMLSICGILLQESARKDQEARHGR